MVEQVVARRTVDGLIVPVRQMMADRTARGGPQQGMMAGEMARDAPSDRALEAAPGIGGVGAGQQGKNQSAGDDDLFHGDVL